MSDRSFDKQALDRYITREDGGDLYDDEIELRQIECSRCCEFFDIPAASKRASYVCDECAAHDFDEGEDLPDERP